MVRRTASVQSAQGKKAGRPSARRDQLVDVAEQLFDRNGFHGTGIDRLLDESGVARMTMYKHFPTKNALVLAALQQRDERFWATLETRSEELAQAGEDTVLAVFSALGEWLEDSGGQGCLVLRALGEFSGHDVAVAGDAVFRKRKSGAWMAARLQQQGFDRFEARAWDLVLLMEGAIALAPVVGGKASAGQAHHAARALLAFWRQEDTSADTAVLPVAGDSEGQQQGTPE